MCSILDMLTGLDKVTIDEGWGEALTLFSQWVSGTGPDEFILGRGSALVEALIDTYPIEAARQQFIEKNAGLPLDEWTATAYDKYKFGPIGAIKAGTNPALHFLGWFSVTITPRTTADGTETITVNNTVSWTSYWRWRGYLGYSVPGSWGRDAFPMCGDMDTTLTWSESILPVTDPSEWIGQLEGCPKWRYFNMYPQDAFVPGRAYHPDVGTVNVDISRFYPNSDFP